MVLINHLPPKEERTFNPMALRQREKLEPCQNLVTWSSIFFHILIEELLLLSNGLARVNAIIHLLELLKDILPRVRIYLLKKIIALSLNTSCYQTYSKSVQCL